MAKAEISHELQVILPEERYTIFVSRGLLHDIPFLRALVEAQVFIVTDEHVAPLYLSHLKEAFSDRQCDTFILKAGENHKTHESLLKVYDALVEGNHHRDTTIIALGGGVVGDLAGFAAATYQRGVPFINIPTTLLAEVDAAIGGKTAVNHHAAKNMIGSFYQPKAVLIDLNALKTLPKREYVAGFAEVIKYAFLAGGSVMEEVRAALKTGIHHLSDVMLADLVASCCRIKVDFVTKDTRELGLRALLNLGHTLGHALESCTHYERFLHGEAVAIGLYFAARLSSTMEGALKTLPHEMEEMLTLAGLPSRIPKDLDISMLFKAMMLDKKVKHQMLRFVLIKKPGDCLIDNVSEERVLSLLKDVYGE